MQAPLILPADQQITETPAVLGKKIIQAAANNDIQEVQKLLEKKADLRVTSHAGLTTLMWLVQKVYIPKKSEPPSALEGGQLLAFKLLEQIIEKTDINQISDKNREYTALYWAAKNGSPGMVEFLIEKKANLQRDGYEALDTAVENGRASLVQVLINGKAPLIKGLSGALLAKALKHTPDSSIFNKLLVAKANVHTCNEAGETPLFLAISNGLADKVKILLENKANPNQISPKGQAMLDFAAVKQGPQEIVQMLMRAKNATTSAELNARLKEAVLSSKWGDIGNLIQAKANINQFVAPNRTVLFELIERGAADPVIEQILAARATVNKVMVTNALVAAVRCNRPSIVAVLLKANADPNNPVNGKQILLMCALWKGYDKVVQVLIRAGAKVQVPEADRSNLGTYMEKAVQGNHWQLIEPLIEAKADIKQPGLKELLEQTAKDGHYDMLLLLIKAKAPMVKHNLLPEIMKNNKPDVLLKLIDARMGVDSAKIYPWAAENGHLPVIEKLLEQKVMLGLNKKHPTTGDTPLHLAAANGHSTVVALLFNVIAGRRDTSKPNMQNRDPLHLAAMAGHADVVALLLESAEQMNPDIEGNTPLHLAVQGRHKGVVEILLRAKAEIKSNNQRVDPLFCAVLANDFAIVEMLLEAKAQAQAKGVAERVPPLQAATEGSRNVDLRIVRALIDAKADVNQRMAWGYQCYFDAPQFANFLNKVIKDHLGIRAQRPNSPVLVHDHQRTLINLLLDARADCNLRLHAEDPTALELAHSAPEIRSLLCAPGVRASLGEAPGSGQSAASSSDPSLASRLSSSLSPSSLEMPSLEPDPRSTSFSSSSSMLSSLHRTKRPREDKEEASAGNLSSKRPTIDAASSTSSSSAASGRSQTLALAASMRDGGVLAPATEDRAIVAPSSENTEVNGQDSTSAKPS